MSLEAERASMAAAARLFGDLLLVELDATSLGKLREPGMSAALADLGIEVPPTGPGGDDADEVNELAADFFALFLQPEKGAPPVQSVWDTGAFEGEPAACIRRHAEAAGLEFDRLAARGAAVDHLGSILHLWSDAASHPQGGPVAEHLSSHHLAWGQRALTAAADHGGFYGQVAKACCVLLSELATESQ